MDNLYTETDGEVYKVIDYGGSPTIIVGGQLFDPSPYEIFEDCPENHTWYWLAKMRAALSKK